MRRRSFLLNAAGLAAVIAGGLWLKDNVLWRKPQLVFEAQSPWIALEQPAASLPVIRLRVLGQPVLALIDSGAQYSVIDKALAERLTQAGHIGKTFDMPMIAYGVGGQAQVGRGTTLSLDMDGVTVPSLRTAILDLGPLARDADGPGVELIIGRDLLREAVVELDLPRRRVRFLDPQNWQADLDMRVVATKPVGDALGVEVSVEGAVVSAVLDTGASSLLSLSEATAREAGILDGRAEEAGQSLVLGGVAKARWVEVSTLTFGDEMRRNERVAVFGDSPLPNYPDALLGIGAFRGRKLALDLGRMALFVEGQLDLTIS
ncbi:pepsin/retropepsin-like aspartic protease family protein [Brevundimonas sp.]|uniref:pepsin/retropepsin-like aspartic protease family protein n=1 Tax=Brevundimonas sp. TaxID=1871086 RepID=UPI002FC78B42